MTYKLTGAPHVAIYYLLYMVVKGAPLKRMYPSIFYELVEITLFGSADRTGRTRILLSLSMQLVFNK